MGLMLLIRYGPGTGAIVRQVEVASFAAMEQWRSSFNSMARDKKVALIAEFEDREDPQVQPPPDPQQVLEELTSDPPPRSS